MRAVSFFFVWEGVATNCGSDNLVAKLTEEVNNYRNFASTY